MSSSPRAALRRALAPLAVACFLLALAAPSALATAPTVTLSGGAAATVLYGRQLPVSLTATAPAGQDFGYNLAFREVLPAGVSYVAGSAGDAGEPTILANQPSTGQTTLIWGNVADLSANSNYTLNFKTAIDQTKYDVGSTFQTSGGAYVSADPRYIAKFNANGTPNGPSATSFTASASVGPTTTSITAIQIVATEPSPEGEIMRGVHNEQTVYTLTVTNNDVNPTANVVVEDWLPAGLEFLGCGGASSDNSAHEEYPGAGPITVPTLTPCTAPTTVETVSTDPDGAGPLPSGVYTHVVWPSLGTMAPSATQQIRFRAAIPIRENTMTWPSGDVAPGASAPATTGVQAVNLDNNTGQETYDEQLLQNGSKVSGVYKSTTNVFDTNELDRTAEDLAVQKSGSSNTLRQGDITKWTLNIEASEYRDVKDIQVDDTLPNGLCPLGSSNMEVTPPASSSECDPVSGDNPSSPFTSATEHADGTWSLHWDKSTDAALAHMTPDQRIAITFYTRTRTHYQSNFTDSTVLLTHDGITNNVAISGPDFARQVNGVEIDHDEIDGIPDTDVSAAGQASDGPVLQKTVGASYPVSGNCLDATYVTTVPAYHPGDRVCWKLHIAFPAGMNTHSLGATDFLPPGVNLIPGSEHTTSANTVGVSPTDASTAGILRWSLGSNGSNGSDSTIGTNGEVFDYVFATTLGSPDGHLSGDITGNLLKFSSSNTATQSFPLRSQADFVWSVPSLTLTKGVYKVNGAPSAGNAANTDHVKVQGGDLVTWRVDIKNTGTQDSSAQQVWDNLPTGMTCSSIPLSGISDGGTCDTANNRVVWSLTATLAAGASKMLTYQTTVPAGVSPATTYTNTAGVRQFTSVDNQGGVETFVPAANIDPTQTAATAPAAKDTSDVYTSAAATVKTATTSINEPSGGNNSATQATIGETITYTVTTTIPQGTTIYGTPKVTDAIPSGVSYVSGSLSATLNGAALPTSGVSIAQDPGTSLITALFPASYANAPNSGDDVLTFTFQGKVLDVYANRRGQSITNTATLAYQDSNGTSQSVSGQVATTIVEPSLALAKTHTGNTVVSPNDIVPFTITATDASGSNVSSAHGVVVVDTVPSTLTPVDTSGNPIADGGTVPSDGGVWNATARTITWTTTTINPGASQAFHVSMKVNAPANAGQVIVNPATATATSLDGVAGARTSTTAAALTPAVGGYAASAQDQISLALPQITKSVSPDPVTIGNRVVWDVRVTLPKNLNFFDTTIVDTVPDGFAIDGYGTVTGLTGVTSLSPVTNSDGTQTAAWFAGDIAPSASDRTVDLLINGHLLDTYRHGGAKVLAGQTLTNSASIKTNRTDKITTTPTTVPATFDDTVGPATAKSKVVEPSLAIAKSADKGPYVVAGDHITYAVKVTNNGTSPAYDISVDDTPDARLTNVVLTTGAASNTDGWTVSDPHMRWVVPGPLAVGASVTFNYTADVVSSGSLHAADTITNTASIFEDYGVPAATRTADGFTYRRYTGPTSTVTLTPDFPALTLTKTTGASGNPDSAPAEVNQPFTWRVVVKNASHVATAKGVDITDTLPHNWSYVAGTASIGGEPTISGQTLTWTNVTDLAPGASVTLTYQAKPLSAAKSDPGSGATHPNINSAVSTADDSTGASGNADGPYTSNSDTAQAILSLPSLLVVKTPDHGAAVAGTDSSFTIKVTDSGAGTARGTTLTDVLPTGLSYTPGTATSDQASGFSETSASGANIAWTLGPIAPGATVTITVPVHVAANVDPGTTLVNTATAHDDDAPADASDTGSLDVSTKADVTVTKVDDPDPVYQGTNLTYTITAKNTGPSEARGVKVTDPLPSGVTFVSASTGCTFASGTVTCAAGTLGVNGTQAFTVIVKVNPDTPAGTIHNTAHVSTTTPESDTTNNDGSADTTVLELADVSITKTANHDSINGGDTVTYTLTAHNDGPGAARSVVITDPLPGELQFVSSNPSSPTCGVSGQLVTCNIGTLAPGADSTVTVTAKALGDPPPAATPGTGDHLVPVTHVEQEVDLDAGQTSTVDLACPDNGIAADGTPRIDAVDQGTGTLADVEVLASHSINASTYEYTLVNHATGRAQTKVFNTCIPAQTSDDGGHSHTIDTSALLSQTFDWGVGQHTVTIDTGLGNVGIAPGFEIDSGAATVVSSENDGSTWTFVVNVTAPAHMTLSIRPLATRTGVSDGHSHALDLRQKTEQVTVPADTTMTAQVICDDDAKGITATYTLPDGLLLLGHDPEPKTRVFKLMNTTGAPLQAMLDLVCLGDRTGPALDPVGIVTNTAHVATATHESATDNNDGSAAIDVARAPVGATPATPDTPVTPDPPAAGDAAAPAAAPLSAEAPSPASTVAPATRMAAPLSAAAKLPVSLVSSSVAVAKNATTASVALTCSAACSGTVELTVPASSSGSARAATAKRVVIGTAKFSAKKAGKVTVTIKIAKSRRALAKRLGSGAQLTIKTSTGSVTKTAKLQAAKATGKPKR